MNEQNNIQIVQEAYGAFGRGDVPALVELMSSDIDWVVFGPTDMPVRGTRRGRQEVTGFFQDVAATWNFERFEPREFIAQDDTVVCLGSYRGTAKKTGRTFDAQFAHVFTVNDRKVVKFREYTDTANLVRAGSEAMSQV